MTPQNPLLRRSKPILPSENAYLQYGLSENPFPTSPTVTPQSTDPKVNGDIYCDELRSEEQSQFERLLIPLPGGGQPRPMVLLMDYATRRGRGIGKTAFINHQRRQIMLDLGGELTGGAYVMLAAHIIPEGGGRTRKFWQFVRLITQSLNQGNCIATAMWRLRAFSDVVPPEVLNKVDPSDMGATLGNDRWLQTQGVEVVWNLNNAVETRLVRAGVRQEVARSLAIYGHDSNAWEQSFLTHYSDHRWRTEGHILLFDDLVRVFQAADINRVLLLVDEVEKIVVPQNSQERRAFVDDLRRFFIDGPYQNVYTDMYGLLLTIHPYIQEIWQPHWNAAGLDRICPIGGGTAQEFTIYFYPLNAEDAAVPLVQAYLDYFRTSSEEKSSLRPFDEEAVVEALRLSGGLPGPMLTLLRLVVERAVKEGWNTIQTDQVRAIFESSSPTEPEEEQGAGVLPGVQTDLMGE